MYKKCSIAIAVLSVSFGANSAVRQYSASIDDSRWQLKTRTRLQCSLAHNIPGYGEASFNSYASKQLNMEFDLDMRMLPKRFGTAALYSVPPSWMPGREAFMLTEMTLRTQYDGDLPESVAWTMLSELEKGYWPTLYYQDWYNERDRITVSLNTANFHHPYRNFVDCVAELLPYSFEDIAFTVLSYEKNTTELTKYSERQLERIAAYLREDSEMELVLIDGYADSYGGRWKNEQLSLRRANTIKDYFANIGVEDERIQVTGHGEKRHVAPNNTPENRAKNRRVVVQLSRP